MWRSERWFRMLFQRRERVRGVRVRHALVPGLDRLQTGRRRASFLKRRERFEQQWAVPGLVSSSSSQSTALDEVPGLDDVRVVDSVVAALLRHLSADLEEVETRLLRSLKEGRHRESAGE